MKPSFVYTHSTIVKPSIDDLAQMVAMLDANDHAVLISLIAKKICESGGWAAMQLQYIADSPWLTDDGRSLMSQIGNYARPLPLPASETKP